MITKSETMPADMLALIREYMEVGLKRELDRLYVEARKKLFEDLDGRKVALFAGISLDILKMVDIQKAAETITIRLLTKDTRNPNV